MCDNSILFLVCFNFSVISNYPILFPLLLNWILQKSILFFSLKIFHLGALLSLCVYMNDLLSSSSEYLPLSYVKYLMSCVASFLLTLHPNFRRAHYPIWDKIVDTLHIWKSFYFILICDCLAGYLFRVGN